MKNRNIFYFDTETSGTDPLRHGIIQIAWILEIDGEMKIERSLDVQLHRGVEIDSTALRINSFTLDRIEAGVTPSAMITALREDIFNFPGSEEYRPCGHNVQFDISFLFETAVRDNKFICHGIDFKKIIDTRSIYCYMDYIGRINFKDYKLSTVCDYYNIPLKAHDALEDVRAVRKLLHLLNP